jgi:hypothetical protein
VYQEFLAISWSCMRPYSNMCISQVYHNSIFLHVICHYFSVAYFEFSFSLITIYKLVSYIQTWKILYFLRHFMFNFIQFQISIKNLVFQRMVHALELYKFHIAVREEYLIQSCSLLWAISKFFLFFTFSHLPVSFLVILHPFETTGCSLRCFSEKRKIRWSSGHINILEML